MPTDWFGWVAASLIAVVGVGRLTRLTAEDSWPPVAWLRHKWVARFNGSGWVDLAICPFCQAPYHAAVAGLWAWATDFHWTWWVFYGWLSVAYLAAMLVARDIPDGEA
jgi:hypothetical protein